MYFTSRVVEKLLFCKVTRRSYVVTAQNFEVNATIIIFVFVLYFMKVIQFLSMLLKFLKDLMLFKFLCVFVIFEVY